jgi:hypothetical protein
LRADRRPGQQRPGFGEDHHGRRRQSTDTHPADGTDSHLNGEKAYKTVHGALGDDTLNGQAASGRLLGDGVISR